MGGYFNHQEYIVDIGISCINIQEQYSRCPKRERYKNDANFQKSIGKWLDKHNLTPEEWDNLYLVRQDNLEKFIQSPLYRGEILRSVQGDDVGISRLPDSFSCPDSYTWYRLKGSCSQLFIHF